MQEQTMKTTIAIVATLLTTASLAQAQAFYGPFTDAEAQLLSAVWPEIRAAEDFEDINWQAHGLARAPGTRDVQRRMSVSWDELRQARRFEQIDWNDLGNGNSRAGRTQRPSQRFEEQFPGPFTSYGPLAPDDAEALASVWPHIREAARFEDINWASFGLARPPGTSDARRILAANWSAARREARFEDIDWDEIVDDRDLQSNRYAGGFGARAANPFARDEAQVMSRVWDRIRFAATFDDIDWRDVGLSGPPGDREARRIMATYWGQLREAEQFEDIDWTATTSTRTRVLR
jgi:hypothetical protein